MSNRCCKVGGVIVVDLGGQRSPGDALVGWGTQTDTQTDRQTGGLK